jgi:hypothetical protein
MLLELNWNAFSFCFFFNLLFVFLLFLQFLNLGLEQRELVHIVPWSLFIIVYGLRGVSRRGLFVEEDTLSVC